MLEGVANAMVTILQFINVSDQHVVHLKLVDGNEAITQVHGPSECGALGKCIGHTHAKPVLVQHFTGGKTREL